MEAEEFVLRDSSGKVRARLSMAAAGPALVMYDARETARIVIGVSDAAPRIVVTDPNGKAALIVGHIPENGPFVSLTGSDGKKTEMQTSSIQWMDSSEKVRMALELLPKGPALRLFDTNERPQAALAMLGADPIFGLYGPNGKPQVLLGNNVAAGPAFLMYDSQGRTIVSLPK